MTWRLTAGAGLVLLLSALAPAHGLAAAPPAVTEFTAGITQGTRPASITAGPDGAMWFTQQTARIGRIGMDGAVTEFPVPSYPTEITAGPDGNLWYTVRSGAVGRISTAGAATEFRDGITGTKLGGITAGPDGNLWFSENSGKTIGRITTSGAVTEFPVGPFANDGTGTPGTGIAAGPDGNLWFTQFFPRQVGRITPQGAVTLFPPDPEGPGRLFNTPGDIISGPDGGLWFTEQNRVGRISTSGVIREFSDVEGLRSFGLSAITAGPDGNVWFAANVADQIGRIVPSGDVTEFPAGATPNSRPVDIAAGPDGNLWFTAQPASPLLATGDLIGRLTTPPPELLPAKAALRTRRVGTRRRVTSLRVTRLTPGTLVKLRCLRGCTVRRNVPITTQVTRDFTRLFTRLLPARASLKITVTKPGWRGRTFTWTAGGTRVRLTICTLSPAGATKGCRRA